IASPSTLIGLLRAVHVGWREKNLSESAQELFELGRELHQRAATVLEHAAIVGDSIARAQVLQRLRGLDPFAPRPDPAALRGARRALVEGHARAANDRGRDAPAGA